MMNAVSLIILSFNNEQVLGTMMVIRYSNDDRKIVLVVV